MRDRSEGGSVQEVWKDILVDRSRQDLSLTLNSPPRNL